MLISAEVWQALRFAGLEATPATSESLTITRHGSRGPTTNLRVLAAPRSLNPSDIREAASAGPNGPTLLVVPTATPAARAAAAEVGWSVVAENPAAPGGPDGEIRLASGESIRIGGVKASRIGPASRRGPIPWGTLNIIRRLLSTTGETQSQLARDAGVSQPHVSQVLRGLMDDGMVGRTTTAHGHQWLTANWDGLLARWLQSYPGAGGLTTHWYGLESAAKQARDVADLLRRQGFKAAVSGDVAADELAPWRRPLRAVVYASRGIDLSELGLTPSGEAEATLEFIVPKDTGVWMTSGTMWRKLSPGTNLPLADPLQVLFDVRRAPGTDRDQAFGALRVVLREHATVERSR